MLTLTTVPTLDAIALNPSLVKGLPRAVLESLLDRCAVEHSKIATAEAALIAELMNGASTKKESLETPNDLLDVKQMAARLGMKESWVGTEARAGRIPSLKLGKYIRFRPADVIAALENPNRLQGLGC